jgi:hypothetical protein
MTTQQRTYLHADGAGRLLDLTRNISSITVLKRIGGAGKMTLSMILNNWVETGIIASICRTRSPTDRACGP